MKPLGLRRHHPAPAFEAVGGPNGSSLVRLRDYSFRSDLLLVLLHGPRCAHCAGIASEMVQRRDDWEGWQTAALVLHSEPEMFPDLPFRQARDEGAAVRTRYAAAGAPADVALAVIEHRGRFMDGWSLAHPAPVDWREVAETVRWVAVQEPECGACAPLPGWDED